MTVPDTWKKINLAMVLPHFGDKPMTDTKLEDLFAINSAGQNKISLMASMLKSSMDSMNLSHVVSHIVDRLKDPSSQGCTEAINNLLNRIWAELKLEEIPLLIEAVEPVSGFMKVSGSVDGKQVQTFEGNLEDIIHFIMRGKLRGI
jgi:hypothetical protein